MYRQWLISIFLSTQFLFATSAISLETVTTKWGGKAEVTYDSGFMYMLMKHNEGGSISF